MTVRLGLRLPKNEPRPSLHPRLPAVAHGRLAPTPRERLARFHRDSAAQCPRTAWGLTTNAARPPTTDRQPEDRFLQIVRDNAREERRDASIPGGGKSEADKARDGNVWMRALQLIQGCWTDVTR